MQIKKYLGLGLAMCVYVTELSLIPMSLSQVKSELTHGISGN